MRPASISETRKLLSDGIEFKIKTDNTNSTFKLVRPKFKPGYKILCNGHEMGNHATVFIYDWYIKKIETSFTGIATDIDVYYQDIDFLTLTPAQP